VGAVTVMVAVAAIVLAVVLLQPTRSTEPIRTEDPLSLALTAGEPVAFTSDAPVEVTLSVGAPADVDLTSDAVPDAVITLTSTDGGSAHLALASPTAAIWDETGFTTSGGTRPYDHHNNAADEDLTVVPDTAGPEGGFLLLHVSGDGRVTSVDAALLGSGGADVAGREQDTALDAALDPASGTLVIASFHRTAGEQHDGPADGGQQLHVVTVAADDGAATRVWDGPTASGSPRAQVTHPMELVPVDEGLALALYDAHAKPDAPSGSADRGRFVLWPWDGSGDTPGWGAGAVVLDGGKPVLADVRIGLNAFAQTPTRAICGAPVALRGAVPVAGATVAITNPAGDVVASPPVSAGGTFEPVELPAKPPTTYTVTVSGNGLAIDEDVRLLGGDDLFMTYGQVPGRGDLRIRSATEGYTSWMVKAGWPGLGEIAGADMYVWYGNYAITVGAEYWDGTDELAAVDVTVWGGTYETHATASEIDFSGWFEPPDVGTVWDVTDWADIPATLGTQHTDALLGLGEGIYGLFAGSDDADEWIETGQGNELLTWAEAQSDFAPHPEFDSSDPLGSMFSVTEAVPRDFAIPTVIGGSSEQQTAVRVDQVVVFHPGPQQVEGFIASGSLYRDASRMAD